MVDAHNPSAWLVRPFADPKNPVSRGLESYNLIKDLMSRTVTAPKTLI